MSTAERVLLGLAFAMGLLASVAWLAMLSEFQDWRKERELEAERSRRMRAVLSKATRLLP